MTLSHPADSHQANVSSVLGHLTAALSCCYYPTMCSVINTNSYIDLPSGFWLFSACWGEPYRSPIAPRLVTPPSSLQLSDLKGAARTSGEAGRRTTFPVGTFKIKTAPVRCAVSIRGQAHVSVYITLPLLYCHNKTTDTHIYITLSMHGKIYNANANNKHV